ncbi:four helix bundle protein [Mucilaginibacter xinganensis]|uniref:Four helix bundle protein n=1 Tax=Mucilaginibacter xinganensis TaxID=1234841 RepID=A0A223NZ07_9SPHI|nr:four helix bundle protein [Mucilaginibacter xinganensis]
MIVAFDEELITEEFLNSFQEEYDQCLKLLNGYIQFIKRKKNNELD